MGLQSSAQTQPSASFYAYCCMQSNLYYIETSISSELLVLWLPPTDLKLHAESCAKLARLKQHLPVRSKVKQQLEQAKALHEEKEEARKQRLKSALGPRYPSCTSLMHVTLFTAADGGCIRG